MVSNLKASNSSMIGVRGSLVITLRNAPIQLSMSLCNVFNSDPYISDLFLACVSQNLTVQIASSVLCASVEIPRSLKGDKSIHITVYQVSKQLGTNGFSLCSSMSKSINYFKNVCYKNNATSVRVLVTILNNRAGLDVTCVCPAGFHPNGEVIRKTILEQFRSQHHMVAYDWNGEEHWRLSSTDIREFIMLFSYDENVHELGDDILKKYMSKMSNSVSVAWNHILNNEVI